MITSHLRFLLLSFSFPWKLPHVIPTVSLSCHYYYMTAWVQLEEAHVCVQLFEMCTLQSLLFLRNLIPAFSTTPSSSIELLRTYHYHIYIHFISRLVYSWERENHEQYIYHDKRTRILQTSYWNSSCDLYFVVYK